MDRLNRIPMEMLHLRRSGVSVRSGFSMDRPMQLHVQNGHVYSRVLGGSDHAVVGVIDGHTK